MDLKLVQVSLRTRCKKFVLIFEKYANASESFQSARKRCDNSGETEEVKFLCHRIERVEFVEMTVDLS